MKKIKAAVPEKKNPSYIDIALPVLEYQNRIYKEKLKDPENVKVYDHTIKSINDILAIIKNLF